MNRYRSHHLAAWFVIAAQFTSPAWARSWILDGLNAQYTTTETVKAGGDAVAGKYNKQKFEFGTVDKNGNLKAENSGDITIAGVGDSAVWSISLDAPAKMGWTVSPKKKADHIGHLVIDKNVRAYTNEKNAVLIVKASTTVN